MTKIFKPLLILFLPFSIFISLVSSQSISFSSPPGHYDTTVFLSLSSEHKKIYYSIGGAYPALKQAIQYKKPIQIDSTSIIRAFVLLEDSSYKVVTTTYFIKEKSELPTISLVTEPDSLCSPEYGIYVNYEKKFGEKKIRGNLEYFDKTGKFILNQKVKLKIGGNASRSQHKKSFSISAIDSSFCYPFFSDKRLKKFKGLKLRADARTPRIQNELIYSINKSLNYPVNMQAYQPSILFINGNYWGIYNIMEKKGKGFIKNNFTQQPIDIIKNSREVIEGSMDEYLNLVNIVKQSDLSIDSVYQSISKEIDISSYIDFWIYDIYMSKGDSYGNLRCWKTKNDTGKWRWINYDMDWWLGYEDSTLFRYATPKNEVRYNFLPKLMNNKEFRDQFFQRFNYLLEHVFDPALLIPKVDSIYSYIAFDMKKDLRRWNQDQLPDYMLEKNNQLKINKIKLFIEERPKYIKQHLEAFRKIN